MSKVFIIVAMAKNRVIGAHGKGLLWHLPADLKHFKDLTMGHAIVMGRKTHESIGRALPGRENIVITHQKDYAAPGCVVVGSLEEALAEAKGDSPALPPAGGSAGEKEIFVIGGGEIYKQALPLADRLYVTRLDHEFTGDVYFPEIDAAIWKVVKSEKGVVDKKNVYSHEFLVLERRKQYMV